MIELFIVLFGGIFCLGTILSNNAAVKDANRRGKTTYERYQQRIQHMISTAVDRDAEADICGTATSRATMDNDFAQLGIDTSVLPMKDLVHLYADLRLARVGKMRERYLYDHNIMVDPEIGVFGPARGTQERAYRNAWIECLLAIETELLNHGVDPFFLWVVPGFERVGTGKNSYSRETERITRLRNVGSGRFGNGRVQSLYATYYDEDLQRM